MARSVHAGLASWRRRHGAAERGAIEACEMPVNHLRDACKPTGTISNRSRYQRLPRSQKRGRRSTAKRDCRQVSRGVVRSAAPCFRGWWHTVGTKWGFGGPERLSADPNLHSSPRGGHPTPPSGGRVRPAAALALRPALGGRGPPLSGTFTVTAHRALHLFSAVADHCVLWGGD